MNLSHLIDPLFYSFRFLPVISIPPFFGRNFPKGRPKILAGREAAVARGHQVRTRRKPGPLVRPSECPECVIE